MLLHIKYLYGIRVEVRGAHHFPPSQPYVVVSNHQSSLDLLGEQPLLAALGTFPGITSPRCPPPSLRCPQEQGGRPSVTLTFWGSPCRPRLPLPLSLVPGSVAEVGPFL